MRVQRGALKTTADCTIKCPHSVPKTGISNGGRTMSEATQMEKTFIRATQIMVIGFAEAVGLDFSEQSLQTTDEIVALLGPICGKIAASSGADDKVSDFVLKVMDETVARFRATKAPLGALVWYEGLRNFTLECQDMGRDMGLFMQMNICTNYGCEVARRNLGGTWTIQRKFFHSAEYGVQIKQSFISDVAILEQWTSDCPTAWYKKLKSQITGMPVAEIQLSSEARPEPSKL
jgi:hypothetical protein